MTILHFPAPPASAGFSRLDLRAFAEWGSGCVRIAVENDCDLGPVAAVYEEGKPWASWAIAREARQVLLWDRVTLATLGRFDSVREALAAIPAESGVRLAHLTAEVIAFSAASASGRANGVLHQ